VKNKPSEMQVSFTCQYCQQKIEVKFKAEPISVVCCDNCNKTFTVMRPTIAEEILIDWENEALFQKIRAEKSQNSNSSLLALVIRVIELLTWRDKGNGQVEAIKEMRGWLIDNEEAPPLAELIQSDVNKRSSKRRDWEK
jgi:transcription elongation factor Elf1